MAHVSELKPSFPGVMLLFCSDWPVLLCTVEHSSLPQAPAAGRWTCVETLRARESGGVLQTFISSPVAFLPAQFLPEQTEVLTGNTLTKMKRGS